MKGLLFYVIGVVFFSSCFCESDFKRRQSQLLKANLLNNYTSSVAPSGNVQVNITFSLISILALEEASQVFRFSASLGQQWIDPWLSWNPALGIQSLNFETSEIWTPDLFIPNGVGEKISNLPASMPVRVFSNGQTLVFIITEFETICNLDVEWYPYDEQVCHMSLMTIFDAQLAIGDSSFDTMFSAYLTGSSEWEMLDTTLSIKHFPKGPDTIPYIDIEFRIRRNSIFYTLSIVFPMCLLSFLNSCVFLLPAASGEKISFLVSIFVSGAVFLNFINDAIPKSSNASRLTIYLVLLLSQSALALIVTLIIMNIHHRQGALLCFFRNKRKITDSKTSEADVVEHGDRTDKMDKVLFLIFIVMAAVSLLVFFV